MLQKSKFVVTEYFNTLINAIENFLSILKCGVGNLTSKRDILLWPTHYDDLNQYISQFRNIFYSN